MPLHVDLAREPAFRLASLDVRPATREVLGRAGSRRVLEPRVMQVLVALARRRGEVVSRDELIDACWRGRAVGDDAVNRCVAALRRLAQVFGGPVIETIARVGYRLDETGAACGANANTPPRTLVAVLPFESLSDEAGMGHLSDGVSEEILQTLAEHTALRVAGRTSRLASRNAGSRARSTCRGKGMASLLTAAAFLVSPDGLSDAGVVMTWTRAGARRRARAAGRDDRRRGQEKGEH